MLVAYKLKHSVVYCITACFVSVFKDSSSPPAKSWIVSLMACRKTIHFSLVFSFQDYFSPLSRNLRCRHQDIPRSPAHRAWIRAYCSLRGVNYLVCFSLLSYSLQGEFKLRRSIKIYFSIRPPRRPSYFRRFGFLIESQILQNTLSF